MIGHLVAAVGILAILWLGLLAFVLIADAIVWFQNQLNFAPWARFVRERRRRRWMKRQ